MDIKNSLWVERYRPKTLDALVLDKDTKAKFAEIIEQGDMPNMLFYGKPGTGKTTVARILMEALDCETLEMNSSLDRGIDQVRNKIRNFAVIRGSAKWRIVLLEEADGMTPEAMDSARNLMETYSDRVRCILTCNYVNKIIDPIRSRCQQIEFKEMPRKECMARMQEILKAEGVKYDKETILRIVDLFYPDMRTMINTAQLSTVKKEMREIREDASDNLTVLELVKAKKINDIRAIAYRVDYPAVLRFIFDHIEELEKDSIKQTEKRLDIAEFMARDSYIADRELNFVACCLKITMG